MVKKKIVIIISILFYAGMLFMTCTARNLHETKLPHVKVVELEYGLFTDGNGETSFGVTLPKKWYRDGEIYRIANVLINDEYRTIARKVDSLEIGLENDDDYQVKNGLGAREKIIISNLNGLTDGCEVYIVEESAEEKTK